MLCKCYSLRKSKAVLGGSLNTAPGMIRHLCDCVTGKRNSASRQPGFIFTFPPSLRLAGLCRDRHVSGSPGKAARSPGPQLPRSAPWLQRLPWDSLQAGPPFSQSPHPPGLVYQVIVSLCSENLGYRKLSTPKYKCNVKHVVLCLTHNMLKKMEAIMNMSVFAKPQVL